LHHEDRFAGARAVSRTGLNACLGQDSVQSVLVDRLLRDVLDGLRELDDRPVRGILVRTDGGLPWGRCVRLPREGAALLLLRGVGVARRFWLLWCGLVPRRRLRRLGCVLVAGRRLLWLGCVRARRWLLWLGCVLVRGWLVCGVLTGWLCRASDFVAQGLCRFLSRRYDDEPSPGVPGGGQDPDRAERAVRGDDDRRGRSAEQGLGAVGVAVEGPVPRGRPGRGCRGR